MNWLFEEEPTHYSYSELVTNGKTSSTGEKSARAETLARGAKGDLIFFYHTGDEKSVVGVMKAAANASPDPADASGSCTRVDVTPVRKLKRPVTLAADQGGHRLRGLRARAHVAAVGDAGHRRAVGANRGMSKT